MMNIARLTSTWPLLSWENVPPLPGPVVSIDFAGHIQAIVNDERR